jgi:hypothetical protein
LFISDDDHKDHAFVSIDRQIKNNSSSNSCSDNSSKVFSLQKLANKLQIDDVEDLYQNGVMYWVHKSILIEVNSSRSSSDDDDDDDDGIENDRYFQINENQNSLIINEYENHYHDHSGNTNNNNSGSSKNNDDDDYDT